MEGRRGLSVVLVLALLGQSFAVPLDMQRLKLGYADNELNSVEAGATDLEAAGTNSRRSREDVIDVAGRQDDEPSKVSLESTTTKTEYATPVQDDDDSDEDDDDFETMSPAPSAGGGSNIFSLLKLANALFPSSSGGANQSKTPSSEAASPFWTLKMDILRALLQFGTSLIGSASSSSSAGSG